MLLEDLNGFEGLFLGGVDVLLVVGFTANQGTEPRAQWRHDLGVGEGHPPQDVGIVLLCLSQERGLFILGGDYTARGGRAVSLHPTNNSDGPSPTHGRWQ